MNEKEKMPIENEENLDDVISEEPGKLSEKEKIFEIEVRIQEIDAILEKYEDDFYNKGEEIMEEEEVDALRQEYRDLVKQKRTLIRGMKKTSWDYIPVWMGVYAIFQFVFSFYLILTQISVYVAEWMYKLFNDVPEWLFYSLVFVVPFLSLMLSLGIYFLIRDKRQRRAFLFIYLIQIIETLIGVTILIISIV